jgi:hypothetical protein
LIGGRGVDATHQYVLEGNLGRLPTDELTSIAIGPAIIVGILTWNIRISAVAGVLASP